MLNWLKRQTRTLAIGAAFVAFLSASIFGLTFSSSYQSCVTDKHTDTATQEQQSTLSRIGVLIHCEAVPLNGNAGAITALGTLAIALFTLTLWVVTNSALRLGRDEFNATHRPRIFVQTVHIASSGKDNFEPRIDFTIVNGGDGKSTMTSYQVFGYGKTDDSAFAPEFRHPEAFPFKNLTLAPGEQCLIGGKCKGFDFEWMEFTSGNGRFFVIGRVEYRGDDNIGRVTGFCREYSRETGMWSRIENSEYEYAY